MPQIRSAEHARVILVVEGRLHEIGPEELVAELPGDSHAPRMLRDCGDVLPVDVLHAQPRTLTRRFQD